MNAIIEHNKEDGTFQTTINNEKAYLHYRKKASDQLEYYETFVPEKQRGQKVASQLAKEALNYAQKNNFQVIPTCSFVASFIKKNQEFEIIKSR
jgi:predicted GNAT family acetyltransferase